MFNFFRKKPAGEKVVFKVKGMHCTSCAMNIDGALEDTEGVFSATTNYPKSEVVVYFDPAKQNIDQLKTIINEQGYQAK